MAFTIQGMEDAISMRIKNGESVRMIARSLGTDHTSLSKAMKSAGLYVPTKEESAKYTWKNHRHPNLGKTGKDSYMYGRKQRPEDVQKRVAKISGPNNYRWSGGRKKHSGGYVLVYAPDHPYGDKGGFVLEHRLVVEQHIGRTLDPSEIVHHKNGNKEDNRIENLAITNRSAHAAYHMNEIKGGKKRAQLNRSHGEIDI